MLSFQSAVQGGRHICSNVSLWMSGSFAAQRGGSLSPVANFHQLVNSRNRTVSPENGKTLEPVTQRHTSRHSVSGITNIRSWNLGRMCSESRPGPLHSSFHPNTRHLHTPSTFEVNGVHIKEIGPKNSAEFLAHYDTLLFDCDGVLWGMDHTTPIPGMPETIAYLRSLGKQILFVTNNSMHDRETYINKFKRYGFDANIEDVFCVAYAASVYLQEMMHIKGSVYLVGSDGMEHELNLAGIPNFGYGPDPDPPSRERDDLLNMHFRDDVSAVLVGYDIHFNLNKIYKAASYLMDPNCLFVATNNLESGIKIAPNRYQPVTGVLVRTVMAAARREPEVVGKPDRHLFECLVATHPNINKSRTLMVGDSIRADIGFAKTVGIDSALVLSGVGTLQAVAEHPGLEPDFYLQALPSLLPQGHAANSGHA